MKTIKHILTKEGLTFEGDFEFEMSLTLIYDPSTFTPFREIKFWFDHGYTREPDLHYCGMLEIDTDEAIELVAEKLKQDFIKFAKTL